MTDQPQASRTETRPQRSRALLLEPSARVSSREDIAEFIFKHLRFGLGVFCSVVILVTVIVYLVPPVYEATSRVLVERGKSPTQRSDIAGYQLEAFDVIMSEIEILKSRTVAEEVVDSLGLADKPVKDTFGRRVGDSISGLLDTLGLLTEVERREKLIRGIQRTLLVEPAPQSSVLVITYRAESPSEATDVARAVMESFLLHHRRVFGDNAADFFEKQVQKTDQELAQLRGQLRRETDPSESESLLLEVNILENAYVFYRERLNTARAAQVADASLVNIRVIDYPSLPQRPTRPRLFFLVLAVVGGAVLAFSLALVREYFDHAVYSAGDIERFFDLPVLGSVTFVAAGLPDPALTAAANSGQPAGS